MATSPLRLEQLVYDRVVVKARRDYDAAADATGEVHTAVRFSQIDDDEFLWRVELQATVSQGAAAPAPKYEIDVRAVGLFRVHPEYPQERVAKLIGITGTSILYSGLRDFLMSITARGPWGPFMLPTTSFIDVEPKAEDRLDAIAAAILAALREQGPLPIGELARALDVDVDTIRSIMSEFRQQGMIKTIYIQYLTY